MSRARRAVRVKPVEVDGYKFASASEAMRYNGLKSYARTHLVATKSTDGRMLVCEWGDGATAPKRTQAFVLAQAGRNKYGAQAVVVDNIKFGSGHEARRFAMLQRAQSAGLIANLVHHPRTYDLIVNSVKIGVYTPDSEYDDVATGRHVVEDAKSEATGQARDWPLRKKLMLACHGIEVQEFRAPARRGKRGTRRRS